MIFDTLDELYIGALNDCMTNGVHHASRAGGSTELSGWVGRLADPRACFVFNPNRHLPVWYPAAELLWYLSGEDSVEMIQAYAPRYERFANDGIVHGAYGKRWVTGDRAFRNTMQSLKDREALVIVRDKNIRSQFAALISLLRDKPETRQAVLTCWNAGDLLYGILGTKNDIPCTLTLQFLYRDGRLNLITTMRSNDLWLGMPNDIFCFCHLQMLVANILQCELGYYQHQVGSLHIYDHNKDACEAAANPPEFSVEPLMYVPMNSHEYALLIQNAIDTEKHNRKLQACFKSMGDNTGGENGLLCQVLAMAATKWTDTADGWLNCKGLRKAAERARK